MADPRLIRTWMYSQEWPEGVIFVVGSPEYKESVLSGKWFDNPKLQGDPVNPKTALGGEEQFEVEKKLQEWVDSDSKEDPPEPPIQRRRGRKPKKKKELEF